VLRNGKQATVPVVAGLTGDSSTAVVSGLRSGQTVVLPSVTIASLGGTTGFGGTSTTSSTGTSNTGGARGRSGGSGAGGPAVFFGS
jgi:hypothetical protein